MRGGGGGGGRTQTVEGDRGGRQWGEQSPVKSTLQPFSGGCFPPPFTPHTTLTSTYLRGGQTDSAHALRARVQAGILGLVQSRVHGEMLLAVHGHHPSRSHAPRRSCVAPDMHVGERTDLTGLLCSLRQQTELPAPPGSPSSSSFSIPPPPLLLPPCSTFRLQNCGPLCASVGQS